jgi:hypothetical protein
MKHTIGLLLLAVIATACHNSGSKFAASEMAGYEEEGAVLTKLPPADQSSIPLEDVEKEETDKKKIIKDGRMGIQVSELENTKNRIDSLVKMYTGYYANERFNNTDYESAINLKIRMPSRNFEIFITDIESGEGEIIYKEIDARDVTDQFIDLETRLENKRNYLLRYQALVKKAKSIKDILDIEEKIRILEEEIESTQGRLKYLSDQVSYSTLDLLISKKKTFKYIPAQRDKFTERLKQSLSKGWVGFIDFLLFVIKIWPFWIIAFGLYYLWKKYKLKRKKKK